jgi:hypothetical protein
MAIVAAIETANPDTFRNYRGEEGAKTWYIPCFLARSLLISILIQIGISYSLNCLLYLVAALEFVYGIFLLLIRPYKSVLHNVGVLFCQFTILYSLSLPFIK